MQDLYTKLASADGIIFGAPVYFFDICAQAKTIIDRTLALHSRPEALRNKPAGIMVSAGSTGTMTAVKTLQSVFLVHRMVVVNWVAIYSPVEASSQDVTAVSQSNEKTS